jgi:hypothetical protein
MVDSPEFPNIFCHAKRPDWGVGILTGEGEGKRSYLFEDGEERTLGAAGIGHMRKVDRPDRDQQQTCAHLLSLLAKRAGRRGAEAPSKSAIDAQLARFHRKYPGGFFGNEWRNAAKTAFAGQARGGVMAQVQARFAAERVAGLLEQQKFAELWDDAIELLNASGLAAGDLQRARPPGEQRLLAEALRDLLHGEQSHEHRFDRFLSAYASVFKDPPSWQTTTALSALFVPVDHVYVEPTSFRKQLKLLALPSSFGARPTGAAYSRCLSAAKTLANMLATRGEVPRDLLDVHDFVRATT